MTARSQPLSDDLAMMRNALQVARRGLGTTAPNPAVGAVIVDPSTGEIIARGWTQPGGRPHAETEAIRRAGARARGATLYVTLEPCAHFGKTPPCADAIVAAGLARVVVGAGDPDPRTKGQGIARLRAAGLDVIEGVLDAECTRLTLGHILRVTEQRPFVQLKMAFDAEGKVPRGANGRPVFVTGPEARAFAHLLRAETDAILVGAGTVIDDDPELTCRLPGLAAQSPVRVILKGMREIPGTAKLIRTSRETPTWVIEESRDGGLRLGKPELAEANPPYGTGLKGVLAVLAGEGITRVLVEGGPTTWARFAGAGFADEVVVVQARGSRMKTSAVDDARRAAIGVAPALSGLLAHAEVETRTLPADDVVIFTRPAAGSILS